MEEAPETGKESLHSAHANGMNEWIQGTGIAAAPGSGRSPYIIYKGSFVVRWWVTLVQATLMCLVWWRQLLLVLHTTTSFISSPWVPLIDQPSTTHPITVLLMASSTVNHAPHTPHYWLTIYSVQSTLVRPSPNISTTEPSLTFFMDYGAHSGTVGWDTVLQAGRSQVWFLPAPLWSCGQLSL